MNDIAEPWSGRAISSQLRRGFSIAVRVIAVTVLPLALGFLGGVLAVELLQSGPALAQGTPREFVRAAGQTQIAGTFLASDQTGTIRASLDNTGGLVLKRADGSISLVVLSESTETDGPLIYRCDRSGSCALL
jgi:hypothetical protein